jgi:hypothetical protein
MITRPPVDSGSSTNPPKPQPEKARVALISAGLMGDAVEREIEAITRDRAVSGPATARRDRGDRAVSGRDVHMRALDRQTQWEIDFAGAGDLESALDARLDALALAGELSIADETHSPSRP